MSDSDAAMATGKLPRMTAAEFHALGRRALGHYKDFFTPVGVVAGTLMFGPQQTADVMQQRLCVLLHVVEAHKAFLQTLLARRIYSYETEVGTYAIDESFALEEEVLRAFCTLEARLALYEEWLSIHK